MTINPVLFGVLCTIGVELLLVLAVIIYFAARRK